MFMLCGILPLSPAVQHASGWLLLLMPWPQFRLQIQCGQTGAEQACQGMFVGAAALKQRSTSS